MRQEFRTVLRKNHFQLLQDLDIEVLPKLIQEGVFTFFMGERIKAEKTRQDQIGLLLTTLERRGDDAFPKFLAVLKEDYSFLYGMIKDNFEDDYDFYFAPAKIQRTIKELKYGSDSDDDLEGYVAMPVQSNTDRTCTTAILETNETLVITTDVEVTVLDTNSSEPVHDPSATKSTADENGGRKVKLKKGDILIKDESLSTDGDEGPFLKARNVADLCLLVPRNCTQSHGDPRGESWFFSREISSRQATLLLEQKDVRQRGVFMVYKSASSRTPGVIFNLSVCQRAGEVIHYPILQNARKQVYINEEKLFMCVQELVSYYHRNRGTLACRLWKCPRELDQQVSAQIPPQFEIDLADLVFDSTARNLGKGNFGNVVLAEYRGTQVAVKSPKPEAGEGVMTDFLEEVQTLMNLHHQNIVKFIGVSSTDKIRLVTEFLAEGDLLRWLRMHPPLDVAHAVHMGCQILSALAYLKQLKYVIHRDVAARNCLMAGKDSIKLSDFGMARFVEDDTYRGEEKEKIPVRWAALETLTEQKYSSASDVWSAGVLFCELFTAGEMPYSEMRNSKVAQHVARGGVLTRPRGCPDGVFDVIKLCWEKEPKKRFPALHLKEMLRTSVYGVNTGTKPVRRQRSADELYAEL